jgi:hypothetical protein
LGHFSFEFQTKTHFFFFAERCAALGREQSGRAFSRVEHGIVKFVMAKEVAFNVCWVVVWSLRLSSLSAFLLLHSWSKTPAYDIDLVTAEQETPDKKHFQVEMYNKH